MKIDWESVKMYSAIAAVVAIVISVIYFSQVDENKRHAAEANCAVACGLVKSQIINNQCHCMSEHGWDLKK